MKKSNRALIAACVALLLVSGCISEYQVELEEQKTYCEMVDIYNETDREKGWPDFKGTYSEWCEKDKPAPKPTVVPVKFR